MPNFEGLVEAVREIVLRTVQWKPTLYKHQPKMNLISLKEKVLHLPLRRPLSVTMLAKVVCAEDGPRQPVEQLVRPRGRREEDKQTKTKEHALWKH